RQFAQQSGAAALHYLFCGAAEIDVHCVVAEIFGDARCFGHDLGIRAKKLRGDGMFVFLKIKIAERLFPGAIIPELVKVFTSVESRHVKEVVTSAEEGGASLGILSGFVAGNFSGYYLGISMVLLMTAGYLITNLGLGSLMIAAPVFAFG